MFAGFLKKLQGPDGTRPYLGWLIVGVTLLFVAGVRFQLRSMALERDEGEYAYAGQLMLHGVAPYKDVYNMKLPGTYAAYALIMAVFGQSASGIHFGVTLVNAASIVLVFVLGRKLLDETTGVVAAVTFAVMSLSPSVLGLAGHATHFVVLPALAGMVVLVNAVGARSFQSAAMTSDGNANASFNAFARLDIAADRNVRAPFLVAGVLFGLALLMKQHGVFFGVFGAAYLVWVGVAGLIESKVQSSQSRVQNSMSKVPGGSSKLQAPSSKETSNFKLETSKEDSAAQPVRRLNAIQLKKLQSQSSKDQARSSNEVSNFKFPTSEVEVRATDEAGAPELEEAVSPITRNASCITSPEPASPKPQTATAAPFHVSRFTFQLVLFITGFVLPYAITCLILWRAGVFHEFVFWTVSYASKYASAVPAGYGPELLKRALDVVVGPNLGLWLLPWAGALLMWWDERFDVQSPKSKVQSPEREDGSPNRTESGTRNPSLSSRFTFHVSRFISATPRVPHPRFFLMGLLFASFASVMVGFHFREHYFVTLLPVLALLTGVAVSRALFLLSHDRSIELFLAVPVVGVFVLGLGAAFIGNGFYWFTNPVDAEWSVYRTKVFVEAQHMADYIKAHTSKDARIAVIGSEPEIYFYSGRRSATGYIYTYPLVEAQPYALKMQEEMISEIERGKPDYVVYVNDPLSWLPRQDSPRKIFDWWKQYWAANLELVNTVNIEQMGDAGDLPGDMGAGMKRCLVLLKRR